MIPLVAALAIVGFWYASTQNRQPPLSAISSPTVPPASTHTWVLPSATQTAVPPPTSSPPTVSAPEPTQTSYSEGLLILSLADGYYRHLFAFHPADLQYTRLTNHPWDDMQPAISPDGTRLAYTSRRNGFWDIYIFDFAASQLIQVTDSPEYDGSPSWAPDGQWLAYESYASGNLDIFIQSLADLSSQPIQLTSDPAADFEPDWSPDGSLLAFTSLQTGDAEIWTAAVNRSEQRFVNRSRNPAVDDTNPAWSPDGQRLAWSVTTQGSTDIVIAQLIDDGALPRTLGGGSHPIWNPGGQQILVQIQAPNRSSLAGYEPDSGLVALPPVPLASAVFGSTWVPAAKTDWLLPWLAAGPADPQQPAASISTAVGTDPATGRTGLLQLTGVTARYPYLSEPAVQPFLSLRQEIARLTGWDVLENLQNLYLPVTVPSLPGDGEDWLYTGLGFAINPLPYQAGWMVVQREDMNGEVYWRLFIRARYQDGSQGQPISNPVWDLNARADGDQAAYENGGASAGPPPGYWVDFTEVANRFGWQRLAASPSWRTFFAAARFNHFAFTRGMNWQTAMEQLYPAELVQPPTPVPTLTSFPTQTSAPLNSRTATAQAGSGLPPPIVLTPRPTWTPLPEEPLP